MSEEQYLPECLVPTVKFGGWYEGVSLNGLGPLVALKGNINSDVDKDILSTFVLSIVEEQLGDNHCLFQHDIAHQFPELSLLWGGLWTKIS